MSSTNTKGMYWLVCKVFIVHTELYGFITGLKLQFVSSITKIVFMLDCVCQSGLVIVVKSVLITEIIIVDHFNCF